MLSADGLTDSDLGKLKALIPLVEGNSAFLSQSFGLSSDDSMKLALSIKLLSTLPIPSKLLNIRPILKTPKSTTSSMTSFNPPPYSNPYAAYMYQYPQVNSNPAYLGMQPPSGHGHGPNPGQSQTTLYVRNLPVTAREDEIMAVFQNFGTVKEARFQKGKDTGEFFGTVFIEYVHASAAKLAHIQMNEKLWGDRTVHIDYANERAAKPGEPEPTPHLAPHTQQQNPPSNSIYVSNLPLDFDKNLLLALFSRFGTILDARPFKKEGASQSAGVAFVDFALQESAAAAIDALDNSVYNHRTIRVSYAQNKRKAGEELGQGDTKRLRAETYPGYPLEQAAMYDPHAQAQWYGMPGGYY